MDKFEASNGITVSVDQGVQFGTDRGWGFYGILGQEWDALREFFRAERDEELGRWRWPENPDYVVYRRGDGWLVLSEQSGNSKHYSRREHAEVGSSVLTQAMRAYFQAHPERKPWEDAKEGEVWIVTPSKALTLGEKAEYPAIFQAGMFRDHGGSWGADDLTSARRIWPEEES